jgi:lysophospholipase L1-like esterase
MPDDRSGSSDRRVTEPGYSSGEEPSSDSSRTGRVLSAARQGRETPLWITWLAQVSKRRLICLPVLLVSILVANLASGILLWLLYGAAAVGLTGVLMPAGRSRSDRTLWSGRFASVALAVSSVFVALAIAEALLWGLESAAEQPLPHFVAKSPASVPLAPELPPEIQLKIQRMQGALTMPTAWQKRGLERVFGIHAYVWQTALHILDANGMRRWEPFPPRDPNRFRVMVVGDSLTYGVGIDAFWTYPEQLERSLAPDFRVEVLNLGVGGYASEDVLNVVRRFLPQLQPDLVVYGVCLNDFLEASTDQPEHYVFPLPGKLKRKLLKRSRVARLVSDRYDMLLRSLGLRPDFYSELLADFDARRRRFGGDVSALNSFVTKRGLPPVVAMVLDQSPWLDGPGRQLAVAAEEQLHAAGIDTVDSEAFYRRFNGRHFNVSRWEGHPNEEAHAIWASMLAQRIRELDVLAPFRRTSSTPATARN